MNAIRAAIGLITLAVLASPASADEPAAYPKPDLLIEAPELEAALAEPGADLVVLHAATPAIYSRARVPGAVLIKPSEWAGAFGDGTDANAWGQRLSATGIGPGTRVVVYGGPHSHPSAARVWWLLKYWGVERASILNGGIQAWVDHAGDAIPQQTPKPKPGGFVAKPRSERHKTTEQMVALVREGVTRLLDARSAGEVAKGVIGSAPEHCEWVTLFDPKTGRYKRADDLRRLLRLDERPGEPVVTYCQTGGRASVTAFALELMGVEQVANYYGSWGAWSKRRSD